jgi:hypothetical protein
MSRIRLLGALLFPALLALVPTGASAGGGGTGATSQGMTLSVPATATVVNRLAIPVTVTATCAPLPNFQGGNLAVGIEEAAGSSIANGAGYLAGLVCDNAPHDYVVTVTAFPNGPPFHGGPAVMTVSGFASGWYWQTVCGYLDPITGYCYYWYQQQVFVSDFASTGTIPIALR